MAHSVMVRDSPFLYAIPLMRWGGGFRPENENLASDYVQECVTKNPMDSFGESYMILATSRILSDDSIPLVITN